MRRHVPLLLLALSPLLTAGKCKDKKPDTEEVGDGVEAASPELELQLISLDPDEIPPAKAAKTTIFGSGIEDGARVWVGGAPLSDVTWKGDNALLVGLPPMTAGEYDVRVQNPDGAEATLHGALWVNADYRDADADWTACGSFQVAFEFDSAALTAASRALLDGKVECLSRLGYPVRIEGHCDERGTTEYNLALGQRRADAIKSHLVSRGLSPSKARTISYGEERPAVSGTGESAWAANRRGEVIAER